MIVRCIFDYGKLRTRSEVRVTRVLKSCMHWYFLLDGFTHAGFQPDPGVTLM